MSDLQRINDEIFPQAFKLLPPGMDTLPARAQVHATGLQESRYIYRVQQGGPAHGYYQFEQGGGVNGVLTHFAVKDTARLVCKARDCPPMPGSVYQALVNDDVLAVCFARLLLFTLPDRLPNQDQRDEGWRQYLKAWRPGMPHRGTWDALFDQAWRTVMGL